MKIFYSFTFILFISSSMYAQNSKNTAPAISSEQKEIKATRHLKKELELKQLSAQPERISDTASRFESTDKRKNKKCKPRPMKKSNRQRE